MYAHAALGRPAAALRAFERGSAVDRAARGFRLLGVDCTFCLTVVVLPYFATDLATRDRIADDGSRAWERARDTESQVQPAAMGHLPILFRAGRWDELAALAPRLDTSNSSYQALVLATLGPFARARGEAATAWRMVRALLPHGPATEPGDTFFFAAQQLQRVAAALALDAGDLPLARAWLEAHDRWLAWSGATLNRSEGLALWSRYHRACGDAERAAACARCALAAASDPPQPFALLAARRALGELAAESGDATAGEMHLAAALALADACAAPYERALTLLALAALRRATGDLTAARQCCREARAICATLGARPALARAEAALAALAALPDGVASYPAGLSAREVEVLRQLAAGHTNRAIAAVLFLSEHTVRAHVRHIFAKTGAENRAAATAFALRHDLA